mmetsp:Transcript_5714/g.18258  ORF Transcript_5714/g.18258 Transcript_5714/m.18258 type:complete len:243 (+) Transcript_5714:622-1350(+)
MKSQWQAQHIALKCFETRHRRCAGCSSKAKMPRWTRPLRTCSNSFYGSHLWLSPLLLSNTFSAIAWCKRLLMIFPSLANSDAGASSLFPWATVHMASPSFVAASSRVNMNQLIARRCSQQETTSNRLILSSLSGALRSGEGYRQCMSPRQLRSGPRVAAKSTSRTQAWSTQPCGWRRWPHKLTKPISRDYSRTSIQSLPWSAEATRWTRRRFLEWKNLHTCSWNSLSSTSPMLSSEWKYSQA